MFLLNVIYEEITQKYTMISKSESTLFSQTQD